MNDTTRETLCTLTQFLVELGHELLSAKTSTDWMSIEDVAEFCSDHSIRLPEGICSASELEQELRRYFARREEMYEDRVNVIASERRMGWDLVFMVRFYSYRPEHLPSLTQFSKLTTTETMEEVTA